MSVTDSLHKSAVDTLVVFSTDILLPLMVGVFLVAAVSKFLVYWTMKRHDWFSKEFEKRVTRFLLADDRRPASFYVMTKRLLEKTYYEIFVARSILKRRRADYIMGVGDRLFLIMPGCAWLVRDILKQVRYLRWTEHQPKLLNITKNTFQKNPCFNKVFGLVSASNINDILNIMPGMFLIGGIFGTFLGIMKALPELGGMDLTNPQMTDMIMDGFLLKIAFAMGASSLGILLSVMMSFINTMLSPEKLFMEMVDRFENTLDTLWNRSQNNDMPENGKEFDEHRDPVEALAEQALLQELERTKKYGDREPGARPERPAKAPPPSRQAG